MPNIFIAMIFLQLLQYYDPHLHSSFITLMVHKFIGSTLWQLSTC